LLEQPGARIAQAVLHGELDLDDVLVLVSMADSRRPVP
jgi:hypothetical protein